MPKNRIIHYGILILVASVLLWIGAELAKRIEWLLPYTAGVGVALIVGGFIQEWWRARAVSRTASRGTPVRAIESNRPQNDG